MSTQLKEKINISVDALTNLSEVDQQTYVISLSKQLMQEVLVG